MSESVEVALGELKVMMLQQNSTLAEIKSDVKAQNGRVTALEGVSREHAVKITNLDREVFARPGRRAPAGDERRITQRDVVLVLGGGGGLALLVSGLWKLLPFLLAGPKP